MKHGFAIVLAACGSPPAPVTVAQVIEPSAPPPDAVLQVVDLGEMIDHDAGPPDASPPLGTGTSARVLARIPIRDGKVLGTRLEAHSLALGRFCGGAAITIAVTSGHATEPRLEEAMTLEIPSELDRIGDSRDAGLDAANRFAAWTQHAMQLHQAVHDDLLSRARATTIIAVKLEGLARIVTLQRRYAELFARAPIPNAFIAEPARTAWCDSMAMPVEQLLDEADRLATTCRDLAAASTQHGWWDTVCAP